MICDQCEGTGKVPVSKHNGITVIESLKQCPKCVGHGKVDWVENVVGKRKTSKQALKEVFGALADAMGDGFESTVYGVGGTGMTHATSMKHILKSVADLKEES